MVFMFLPLLRGHRNQHPVGMQQS